MRLPGWDGWHGWHVYPKSREFGRLPNNMAPGETSPPSLPSHPNAWLRNAPAAPPDRPGVGLPPSAAAPRSRPHRARSASGGHQRSINPLARKLAFRISGLAGDLHLLCTMAATAPSAAPGSVIGAALACAAPEPFYCRLRGAP